MQRLLLLVVIFIICGTLWQIVDGKWICALCLTKEDCEQDPVEFCIWGETRDMCNRRVCAKGPGERCGSSLDILGQCGEGMMCMSEGRCHGCSFITLQCYP